MPLETKIVQFIIAGVIAETIASTAILPLEAARIRMISDPSFSRYVLAVKFMINGMRETVMSRYSSCPQSTSYSKFSISMNSCKYNRYISVVLISFVTAFLIAAVHSTAYRRYWR